MSKQIVALTLLGCSLVTTAASADIYPSRPVTIVVPSAAGGVTDVVARAVSERLSAIWGQQFIIDNRTGGGHNIAAAAVMKARPDGYTWMITEGGTFVTNPHLYAKGTLSYDAENDFTPITGLVRNNPALVAHPSLPARDLSALVELAKKRPGTLTYGTGGIGTGPHMAMILLESLAGVKLVPVHYRGAAPALNDVLGGHTSLISLSATLALAPVQGGLAKVLVVGRRLPQLPDVPTAAESGLPEYDATSWFGLFAPAKTPAEIVGKINAEVQRVLSDAAFRDRFLTPQLLEPMAGSPDQFAAHIGSESRKWATAIRTANIKLD
jgi:tripartite-type tricarboxylate transporter receptor subunit TctC